MEINPNLEKILNAFVRYYTIKTENVTEPFNAEAEFKSHGEQYILIKAAKIADIDSNEYVFFKVTEQLDLATLKSYSETAWQTGQNRITPYYGHKNTDISLVVLANNISEDVKNEIKRIKYSKSYKFTLFGWSNFKLVVKELDSNQIYSNRFGSDLKKLLSKIN